jgi:hypothetical protein
MTNDFAEFVSSIGPIQSSAGATETSSYALTKKVDNREKHSCFECAGTGIWKGHRVHQPKRECFACKGKGYFLTSPQARAKAKQKGQERKAKQLADVQAAFNEQFPGVIDGLRSVASWNQFAVSLLQGYDKYGALTDGQVAAAQRTLAKIAEKAAERAAERSKQTGDVDVTAIVTAFQAASANGLKRPRFRAERIEISLAPVFGKNAGALYVKCDGAYSGKIVDGKFSPVRAAPADILELVRAVAANPLEAAKLYGKKTGTCSCCGRELTDPVSIENGIGPICETKWGF